MKCFVENILSNIELKTGDVPLYNAIKRHTDAHPVSFHMPGHKNGVGLPDEFVDVLSKCDLTELPGLDNLHYPQEAIEKASELTAKVFGADRTFFLVNGSSVGIIGSIMSVCNRGDTLIVSRDCHKSVINAMQLVGVEPVYILPKYSKRLGVTTCICEEDVSLALDKYPNAVGVVITRPTYYGICSNISTIVKIAHNRGKILIVDEAHGAHLKFSRHLPSSSVDEGADICVQSAHKTLPAFSQGAYLHLNRSRVDEEKLESVLRMLQTSSPSYMIMASLDIARYIMHTKGSCLLEKLLENIARFESKIQSLNNISILSEELIKEDMENKLLNCSVDKTKVVLNFKNMGITGCKVQDILYREHNIYVEMSDYNNVICLCTIADKHESFERLYKAILQIVRNQDLNLPSIPKNDVTTINYSSLFMMDRKMSLEEAFVAKSFKINLLQAIGYVSKYTITPYPPGIPLIMPGEIITENVVEYLKMILSNGGMVEGIVNRDEVWVVGKTKM